MITTKTVALWLLAVGLLLTAASMGYAQNTTENQSGNNASSADEGSSNQLVLAGCLARGSGADEYSLLGPALHTWELKSESVDLGIFLDEDVRVTAVKSPANDGTFTVTDLAVVSPSCASW